jgi:hypothetical protein
MGKAVENVLIKWAQRTIQNMKKVLSDNYKVNTGRLYNSITYDIDETNKNFSIKYISYGKYVDSGRRAGAKPPPRLPLLNWLSTTHGRKFLSAVNKGKDKKITDVSASYMLQKSISKKGIRPVKFLNQESKIKNVVNVFGSFKTDMTKALISEIPKIKTVEDIKIKT